MRYKYVEMLNLNDVCQLQIYGGTVLRNKFVGISL